MMTQLIVLLSIADRIIGDTADGSIGDNFCYLSTADGGIGDISSIAIYYSSN